jgi:hypothetical protein
MRRNLDRFQCFVAEQPSLHVPGRLVAASGLQEERYALRGETLQLSPNCVICGPGELPPEIGDTEDWEAGLGLDHSFLAWVKSPTGAWHPFWLTQSLAEDLAALEDGGAGPSFLRASLQAALVGAGILTTEARLARAEAEWSEAVHEGKERFARDRYLPLSELLHPYHLGELRRYYRRLIRLGKIRLGDSQSSRRYVLHNEPVARFFHRQLTAAVSALASEPLLPSYVYFASYVGGAELERHTDREQCEVSLSLCIDYAPEPAEATPWPLLADTPEGTVTVRQALGDALLYRGCELPHYRRRLADGHTSTSFFLHYVPVGFQGSLR